MMGPKVSKLCMLLLAMLHLTSGLHFYLDTNEKKCFFEDLPQDTFVVGRVEALEYDEYTRGYRKNGDLVVQTTIYETFDNNDKVYDNKGDISFTSSDKGEHMFCLVPFYKDGSKGQKLRVFFDLAMGDSDDYLDSKSTRKVDELTLKVQNLNKKLEDIHSQQEQMREREAIFRDQSESTNSRVVKWTLIQLVVLIGTCVYQLNHLKKFFVKQKIV